MATGLTAPLDMIGQIPTNQQRTLRPLETMMTTGLTPPDVIGQIPILQQESGPLASWRDNNNVGFGTHQIDDDLYAEDYESAEDTNSRESEEDDLRQFLASLSAEEVAVYRNLTGSAAATTAVLFPAAYHKTKSADFKSFETVANPDADITVRKVRIYFFSFFRDFLLRFKHSNVRQNIMGKNASCTDCGVVANAPLPLSYRCVKHLLVQQFSRMLKVRTTKSLGLTLNLWTLVHFPKVQTFPPKL